MQAVGEVSAFYQNIRTGRMTKMLEQKNMILFEGADVMAALLGGDLNFRISHFYLEYKNTVGTPTAPTITRDAGRSYFSSLDGSAAHDWVRVPIILNPTLSVVPAESSDYTGNSVIFTATTASVTPATGKSPVANYFLSSGVDGPSKITSLALVASPDRNAESKDRVFSRVNLGTPMPLQPSSNIIFLWAIRFN